MPGMSGVELLAAAQEVHPGAKRALLTAYADTDAAIAAINEVHAHHDLLKPWDPPEERLYPVLDELLEEWLAGFRPPFEGVRVVAPQWSPPAHRLKEFLGRNRVPYRSIDPTRSRQDIGGDATGGTGRRRGAAGAQRPSSSAFRAARSLPLARRTAGAMNGVASFENPAGSPRLRRVMRVDPDDAGSHV